MEKKKVLLFALAAVIATAGFVFFKQEHPVQTEENSALENVSDNAKQASANKDLSKSKKTKSAEKSEELKAEISHNEHVKKANLYSSLSNNALTLSGITELSKLSQNTQNNIHKITSDSNNIYYLKHQGDKIFLIIDNPSNLRHGIEFVEISDKNGHQIKTTLGYNDKMKDSDNDKWEFVKNSEEQIPLKHTKYDEKGDVEFIETWNYDDNPIKYEMKDSEGHVLSMKKEILDTPENLRVEHLVYDKDGKTKINVSATFEGPDIKRFTYYNADKPNQGASVFSEYSEGLKTKETVYTSDLKVQNTYTSIYKDGERKEITVYDGNEKEVGKFLAE